MRKFGLPLLLAVSLLFISSPSIAAPKPSSQGKNNSSNSAAKSNPAPSKKEESEKNTAPTNSNNAPSAAAPSANTNSNPNNSSEKGSENSSTNSNNSGSSASQSENQKTNSSVESSKGQDNKPENPGNSQNAPANKLPELQAGESKSFVVQFKDSASVAGEAVALRSANVKVNRTFNNAFKGLVAVLNSKQLEALQKNPNVEIIEEDFQVFTTSTIQSGATWGLDRIDQRSLPLNGTFSYANSGSGTVAYVVDTGVRAGHEEFTSRITSGFSAFSDGRGTEDCNGHGTHVAGTIGGSKYGVSKSVIISPVRVLDCNGSGTISGVIAGLDWIAANHKSAAGVVNMSLGGGASSTLDSAVNNLINRGLTIVVAAGNSQADACNSSPARVPAAITVAASNASDGFASFSNRGSCVDIIAPGVSITSAWYTSNTATNSISGTSMAAPHVAGVVSAFMNGAYYSPNVVDAQIKSWATQGVISSVPSGTINLLIHSNPTESVPTPIPSATLPTSPTNVNATPLKRAATVNWKLSDDDGGSAITSQLVTVWSGSSQVRTIQTGATSKSLTVRSLNANLLYRFSVIAVNSIGQSPSSPLSNEIRPLR